MIHIFVGTKAQLIKMMPIMRALDRRGVSYNFINTGQHAGLTADLIKQFRLRQPDVSMRQGRKNINSLAHAILWTIHHLGRLTFSPKRIYRNIFKEQSGVCLIHGDTLTTLISLVYAKRCGLSVAHVESGLRSFNVFDPFPEEIIRLIATHFSDILFSPSDWAFDNLCKMGYHNKAVNVVANTGMEAFTFAFQQAGAEHSFGKPYGVVTIHRAETIFSYSRLMAVIAIVERIARNYRVLFVMHEPTRRQLRRFDLLKRIQRFNMVETLPLQQYVPFITLLSEAEFVITDGGSIQEECYYLNKPCMILRSHTERMEGLGENIVLAEFDPNQIERFLEALPRLRRQEVNLDVRPSDVIVDYLLACK